LRSNEHLKTPPNLTSSPKTVAVLSVSRAISKALLTDWKRLSFFLSTVSGISEAVLYLVVAKERLPAS